MNWYEDPRRPTPHRSRDIGLKGLTQDLIDDDIEFLKEILQEWED